MNYTSNISPEDREKWIKFCNNHKRRNFFQTFDTYDFWNSLEGYKPFIFNLESEEGECLVFCTGVVVRKGKSKTKNPDRTTLIYGGPLIKDDRLDLADKFIVKLSKYLKLKSKYIEFRNLGADLYLKEVFLSKNWIYTPKVNYLIDLDNEEDVFGRFSRTKKQKIKKSIKNEVTISYEKSEENLQAIYKIISGIFKKNDKRMTFPIPDYAFLKLLMKSNKSGLSVAIYKGEIIGGGVFVFDHETIYHWFRGGLREFRHLNPDSLVDWSVMQFGLNNGLNSFDFMGAGRKDWDNAIRVYKSRFGGELVENGMYSKASFPLLFRFEDKIKRMRRASAIL